jgi:signal transduction histidine kinase
VALRNYVLEWAHKNGIETSFHMDDGRPMQPDIEYAVFRITQEALANIARHSLAHQAQVKITHSADEVSLEVRDNGCGFDLEHHHQGLGLDSMRERATIANGSFLIESAPGQGTRVCIRIPLQKNTVR